MWRDLPTDRLLADVSLWSADLAALGAELQRIEPFADVIHLDVADGHFAPDLLFFPDLVAAVRQHTRKPLHVHLMVDQPLVWIDRFAAVGVDFITVHYENGAVVPAALARVREHGLGAGLALGLNVAPEAITLYLDHLDLVVLLGTQIGVKGRDPDDQVYARIAQTRRLLHDHGVADQVRIEADGGIRSHTVPRLRAAGADLVVPGSLVFGSDDLAATFRWLHTI